VVAWAVAVAAIWLAATLLGRYGPVPTRVGAPRSPVEVLSAWDGSHYADLAANGYSAEGDERRQFGFFPLLPMLARALGAPLGHPALAGILLSQLCLLGSVLLLGRLAHGGRAAPLRLQPGFWLLVSPLGFFLSALYTESLFLVLVLLMVTAYRHDRLAAAGAFGVLVGLARATALTVPALFALDVPRRFRHGTRWWAALVTLGTPWVGIALWMALVGYLVGDPLGYLDVMNRWWRHAWAVPFAPFVRDVYHNALLVLNGELPIRDQIVRHFSTAAVVALTVWGWRRLDRDFLVYLVVSMLFLHANDPPISIARHELVLFPVYLLIPQTVLGRPRVAPVAAALLVAVQALYFYDFAMWRWVA
jgi:hypothetical protein